MDIPSFIRSRREHLKLTQQQLADMAGLERRTIISLEAGANVELHTLNAIAAALGTHLALQINGLEPG